jgi:hypothetical protein
MKITKREREVIAWPKKERKRGFPDCSLPKHQAMARCSRTGARKKRRPDKR